MPPEPRTAHRHSLPLRTGPWVHHLLSAAVDASPLAITRAEVRDADDVVAALHRPGQATALLDHSLEMGDLTLVLEGEVTTATELQRFAHAVVPPVRALIAGAGFHGAPAPEPDPDAVTIDLADLADLEHRVRTRLTVARGWVELVRTRGASPRPDIDPLAIASRQLSEIEEVLRTGLARARTASGIGPPHEPLDLGGAVERILAEAAWSHAPHVTGPIVTGEPRAMVLDEVDLRDALLHLLDNATRHTPPDTAVEVRVSYRAGWVEVAVEDAGPGLPPAAERSSGLGTRVVRRLAADMEAHLEFDRSVELGGAAVRLLWHVPEGRSQPRTARRQLSRSTSPDLE